MSIAWVSGATGKGVAGVLRRVTELVPLWSTVPTTLQLNAWRKKMALGLAGNAIVVFLFSLTASHLMK